MRCSNCGSDNPAGKKFCSECGAELSRGCPQCGAENAPAAKFCGDCGAALSVPLQATVAETAPVQPREIAGERRHLTVLFCDLVGSTQISAQLDPEEWREIVAGYHRAAAEAITRFGGHVAKYLGDGVMAFFGYPEAHDNDAERAARAGLAIIDGVAKLNEQPARPRLSARVGIDSGSVVVGAGLGKDADVFGDAPNIAARVQEAAAPGTVVMTEDTHRLVSGLFVVEGRGAPTLKGVERPIQLYRVVQPSGVRGRLEAAAARGLTPFVGREDELRLLMNRWERALDGEGQVALIIGEAGIGKSRLVQHFHVQITGTPHTWIDLAAAPIFQNTPFYPVGDMLKQALAWRGNESAEEQLTRLESALELARVKPAEALPLLAPLLNLALPAKYPPSALSPEQQRRRLLATLVELAMGFARVQPTVITIEDLHWADPSTLELIQLLVEQRARVPLLLVYTARPEFRPQWPLRAHHTQIMLNRLSDRQAREMVVQVAAGSALAAETAESVVGRSTGVPLFVEELTRAVLESGNAKLTGREIPATLQASLIARLDRLGAAREVAQAGATIGDEFSYELLRAVAYVTEDELKSALGALLEAELLYVHGIAPEATYLFKHALVRDIAYDTLLKSRRRELHRRVAEAIEKRFPEMATTTPEFLAHHYTEAGLFAEAVRYWRKAGLKEIERSAHREAIAHLKKGLELVNLVPETRDRVGEEFRLQLALTDPLAAVNGYSAPETEKACNRAIELSAHVGESPQLFAALGRVCSIYHNRGNSRSGLEVAERMLRLAQMQHDPRLLLWAHYALGFNLLHAGKLALARDHLEQSVALYDRQRGGTHGFVQDPGPTALALLAHVLCSLGYLDQAMRRSREALALARDLAHPFTLAWVLSSVGEINSRIGRNREASELWTEEARVCELHGFEPLLAGATVCLGLVLVEQGREEEGIAQMTHGLSSFAGPQAFSDRLVSLGRLASAYGRAGRADEGLAVLSEAKAFAKNSENQAFYALLYHLEGELLVKKDAFSRADAEQCFRTAIEIARQQSARTEELGATTSLARLLDERGRRDEARTMLSAIYGWFTEGFDTADLKDAKALLDELSR
jgi:class 3 adenylate cyclase/tetratricopeptide (TPR) repeat protein